MNTIKKLLGLKKKVKFDLTPNTIPVEKYIMEKKSMPIIPEDPKPVKNKTKKEIKPKNKTKKNIPTINSDCKTKIYVEIYDNNKLVNAYVFYETIYTGDYKLDQIKYDELLPFIKRNKMTIPINDIITESYLHIPIKKYKKTLQNIRERKDPIYLGEFKDMLNGMNMFPFELNYKPLENPSHKTYILGLSLKDKWMQSLDAEYKDPCINL